MGYCVNMCLRNVVIPKENVKKCLKAINALHSDENLEKQATGGSFGAGVEKHPVRERKWYSWVRNPKGKRGFKSLIEALEGWRYEAEEQQDGSVLVQCFTGEKWGDDEILYGAIAPFVHDGGKIKIEGEDGEHWAYAFRSGKIVHMNGRVIYEEVEEE